MALMTVQNLRDYARNALDSDSDEFPDSLCDVWRDEAIDRILRSFEPWTFLEKSWTYTSDGSQSVLLSTVGSDIETVSSVKAARWLLKFMPHEAAVQKYAFSALTGGLVVEWSIYALAMYFWPAPSSGDIFVVEGHRTIVPAVLATDVPDMPAELHPLIGEYMTARALEKQGDFFVAPTKFQRFEEELESLRRRFQRGSEAGVQAIGEGRNTYPFFAERLAYDWE